MIFKFNNSIGAVLCEKCRIIDMEGPFQRYELDAIHEMSRLDEPWFCKECDPKRHKEQSMKFVEIVGRMAERSIAPDSKSGVVVIPP